jgi:hypothetical protein
MVMELISAASLQKEVFAFKEGREDLWPPIPHCLSRR